MQRISRAVLLGLVASVLLALGPAGVRAAQVWHVDGSVGASGDGTSWAAAFKTLQEGLVAAASGDEIWVAAGTYLPADDGDRNKSFGLVAGVALYGGFAGGEVTRDARDWVANETVLSGDIGVGGDPSDNSQHVVVGASDAVLDGFTVTGGKAESLDSGRGGGLYCDDVDDLAVSNCRFSDNAANGYAGAIYGASSSITAEDCTFLGNTAGLLGGAVFSSSGTFSLSRCTFTGNSGDHAGAVGAYWGDLQVADSWFSANSGECGGAIRTVVGSLSVHGSAFYQNVAADRGGALYVASDLVVTNSTFVGNTAGTHNGGICAVDTHAEVVNCILWGNDAPTDPEFGGGAGYSYSVRRSCVKGGCEGAGILDVDPALIDPAAGDLHLQAGSPCIDFANGDVAPAKDMEGHDRRDDPGMANGGAGTPDFADIGAYEFQGSTAGSWLTILKPPQNVAWRVGREVEMQWVSTSDVSEVTIEIDRGAGWETIVASGTNDRSLVWTVSDGGQALPQRGCRIRVSNAAGGTPNAVSDLFAIFTGVWHVDCAIPVPGDGLTWAEAMSHPQDAADSAHAGDEIWVAAGTYVRRSAGDTVVLSMKRGVAIYGGFAGTETARDQRDWVANETVLDGEDTCYHVVIGASASALDGFTITRGNANGINDDHDGAGMFNAYVGSDLSVANCLFLANVASLYGGGISNVRSSPGISGCTFESCSASDGGGVSCASSSSPVIRDCVFLGNTASLGGGLYANLYSSPALSNCTFVANSATSRGGGVFTYSNCSPTFVNCEFLNNTSDYDGAGINNQSGASAYPGFPRLVNCTFYGNQAANEGGAFRSATGSTPEVSNCIFWGNSALVGDELFGGIGTVSHTCIAGGHAGIGNVGADPLFMDAAAGDLRLQPVSPCIDAADGDAAPDVDIDGLLRYDDPGRPNTGTGTPDYADMGAYESGGSPTGTVTGTVILEDGADPAQINITAGGQTASTSVVSDTIEYTIYNVPGITVEVNVETTETGYLATGSPATITWVGTEGSAANTTVTTHGTVLGAVVLEDGADGALVTATAGGQTAITAVGAGTMDYTISNVPLVTAEGTVGTTEAGYEAIGSPAAINWIDADGTMAFTTVRVIRGTVTGQVTLINNPDPALVTIIAGGQTAVKTPGAGVIDYSISNVPVVTAEVTVSTTQPSCTVTGSPAIIAWAGPSGAATDVTVTAPAIIEEDGCTPGRGSFGAWLVPVALLLSVLTMRRKREAAA